MTAASPSIAQAAAEVFGSVLRSPPRLVRDGENQVYELDAERLGRLALRVHRDGYHTDQELVSEAQWMSALSASGCPVPAALRTPQGDLVARAGDPQRRCTLLRWLPGTPVAAADPAVALPLVGRLLARLHEHATSWTKPPGFTRPVWDAEALCGASPRWGHWSGATRWKPGVHRDLEEAAGVISERLGRLGKGGDVFGLIHADLTPTNVLLDQGIAAAIDFDDCGMGWHAYDVAAAVWEWEPRPDFPLLCDTLTDAYRDTAGHPVGGIEEMPTLLMARRLALLGWLEGRSETSRAITAGPARIASTPARVRDFLRWAHSADAVAWT